MRDIYKLLYQGCYGVGHIISSRDDAMTYLRNECESLVYSRDEPLLRPCNADQTMLRVNLRPLLREKREPGLLVDAMLETANMVRPDTAAFLRVWNETGTLIEQHALPFDHAEYVAFTDTVRAAAFPAVHHSAGYAAAYRPAYRVVLRSAFEKRFGSTQGNGSYPAR